MGTRFFKETIRDVDLRGRTVLVRVDYNVPLTSEGEISDDLRIRASLPTIKYLIDQRCKIVLISHLGRPHGKQKKYSLDPVAAHLANLLGQSVRFIDDCVGDKVHQMIRHARRGSVTLLENLRFYDEEEADDLDQTDRLAYDGPQLAVDQLALTLVVLELPMRFLCKEECEGLPGITQMNREADADQDELTTQHPFSALQQLLNKDQEV